MSLFAIGDTHLSFGTNKPMNIFHGWNNYVERLEQNWRALITPADTVVIMGDVSWGMSLQEAQKDFAFLNALPGSKIILKGNHDYWWNTRKKMEEFLQDNAFDSIKILHNNAYRVGNLSICGTRGWFLDAEKDADERIVLREAQRLKTSIQAGRALGGAPVVFLHYPPISHEYRCRAIYDLLTQQKISRCYYAHLHGSVAFTAFNGESDGVRFELLSADYLKFCPKLIEKIK